MSFSIDDITELLGKYFSGKMYSFITKELENIDLPNKGVFYKVSQKADYPEFELMYVMKKALIIYKFARMKKDITTIPLRKISEITITKHKVYTRVIIGMDERVIFNSRTSLKSKARESLEELYDNVQEFLVAEGQDG